ncbi:hypothetical protein A2903_02845 [Candidatus Nomurabacteria bacterium RIFCSPLOWO2_01_FULL_33_17]|uniref:AAA+ ATPase domain-containing protein n=1 Tax=Candidatus Nomurabacteria bacterium RIFCSPLOWO2_01_FULL_33_17 TaxID=1801764 RepID=A0A1F6WN30_9BACT|nr:MAG: hypothetical protein A2903_02845 [Candidatus Nomurabacteria bacterium RIFCSPLOWO2_01_FULL_33_17]
MYIKRNLETKIMGLIETAEIIAVVGSRQAGKTTLLKHISNNLKSVNWLTFEDQDALDLFDRDIKAFIEIHIKPYKNIFIDEFQYSREGGKNLKFIYDTVPNKKMFITGSSHADISVRALKYLVGRVFIFELFPLSFDEFIYFRNVDLANYLKSNKNISNTVISTITPYMEEFIKYGGYPKVVLSETEVLKKEVLKNIVNTYFLRDIKEGLGLVESSPLRDLLKTIALSLGSLVPYKKLTDVSNYDHLKLKKYLSFFEQTYITYSAKPFFKNKLKEIVKAPKVYFLDSGLCNTLLSDFRAPCDRPDGGGIFEMVNVSEFVKSGYSVNYWRTKNGLEVDIVAVLNESHIACEVKLKKEENIVPSLESFVNEYKNFEPFISFLYLNDKISKTNTQNQLPLFFIGNLKTD